VTVPAVGCDEAVESINEGGYLLPGERSLLIYLTEDIFHGGEEAHAALALDAETPIPTGYHEIPCSRIFALAGPYPVPNGAATEYVTPFPIYVADLPFSRFG
jgi:hypothetical protein